jgi:corrinoid protein of di/trimethylamine methyltransferase
MSKIKEIAKAIESGKVKIIEGLIQEALDAGEDANTILEDGMIAAMSVVGTKFQNNEFFVPEMLVAAKTMRKGVEFLRPHLSEGSEGKAGKFIIGTVAGDLHDIGKNLVALMIESAGFKVIDLGVDVPAERFIEALKNNPDCKVIGASALLTTTMEALKSTVQAINDAGYKDKVKIMVGGAPVTQEFADDIGADAYCDNAGAAVDKILQLIDK